MIIKECSGNVKLVFKLNDLDDLFLELFNTSVWEWIGDFFAGDKIDSVMSVTVYPLNLYKLFEFDGDSGYLYGKLRIGTYTLQHKEGSASQGDIRGYDALLKPATNALFTVGTIDFRKDSLGFSEYGNIPFFFYEPYSTIDLYLPYIGFIQLQPSLIIGNILEVKYGIDFDTNVVTAFLFSKSSNDDIGKLIMTFDGSIGYKIALSHSRTSAVYNNIVQTAVKVGGAIMSSGTSLAADYLNAETFSPETKEYERSMNRLASKEAQASETILSNSVNIFNAGNCIVQKGQFTGNFTSSLIVQNSIMYALITLPTPNIPTNYEHLYGRPLLKSKVLKDIHGFTQIDNIHLKNFSTVTDDEINMINSLLKSGIILP